MRWAALQLWVAPHASYVRNNSAVAALSARLWKLHTLTACQDPPPTDLPSGQSGLTLTPILPPAQQSRRWAEAVCAHAGDAWSAGPPCQSERPSNGTMRCPARDTSLRPHLHNVRRDAGEGAARPLRVRRTHCLGAGHPTDPPVLQSACLYAPASQVRTLTEDEGRDATLLPPRWRARAAAPARRTAPARPGRITG